MTDRAEVQRELDRVVDRLNTMTLARAHRAVADCHRSAQFIVDRTPGVPREAVLPELAAGALAAQLAVVGRDYLDAPPDQTDDQLADVLATLVQLRRSLP